MRFLAPLGRGISLVECGVTNSVIATNTGFVAVREGHPHNRV